MALASSIWLGWITHFPSQPRTAERVAADWKPSSSRKSANGPSIGRRPCARAATTIRIRG